MQVKFCSILVKYSDPEVIIGPWSDSKFNTHSFKSLPLTSMVEKSFAQDIV